MKPGQAGGGNQMNEKYEVVFEKYAGDLKSNAMLFRHKKTGARVFVLGNDDDNKVFYIGFRTPPEDSTGVAHIIEHSVLCGSEKYPLKDPFVELVKGSLNTFLNAMTYPDKTVYPVASRNDKDFANLMSVYMDAVFNPAIYRHEEIFRQEGWSYKLESPEDALSYNGVVYNEMKGAFSSPESVLERRILNSLYPDTCYGVESGGDPDVITELTYEGFLDFHRRFYHPSNSFIYLYGDMDIEERLEWMDREYLSKYGYLDTDSEIRKQEPFEKMQRIEMDYPVGEDESETENTYLAYNIACGDNLDPKKYYGMQMVLYALADTQGAPVRKRLLDAGIGKDILPSFENGLAEEYFSIVSKNAERSQAEDFLEIINGEFTKAANEGINKKSLTASLNSMKFRFKEADYGGYPKGLIYGLSALDSWLYDETKPLLHLEVNETFRFLEEAIETDYFENLIKTYLLGNSHSSLVVLTPKKGLTAKNEAGLAKKLEEYKAGLSEAEIEKIVKDTEKLKAYQEEEPTKEELLSIPLLDRSDIKRDTERFSNIEKEFFGLKTVWHDYYTSGISYVDFIFTTHFPDKEMLPYFGLLKYMISFVDTEKHTYSDLNDEINIVTGGIIAGNTMSVLRKDSAKFSIGLNLSLRTLCENFVKAMDLVEEVLFEGKYDDAKRLKEIIAEQKSRMQMTLNSAGHAAAAGRAGSYCFGHAMVKEATDGIEFYKFIENLDRNFDSLKDKLMENITKIIAYAFRPEALTISFTGDREGLGLLEKRLAGFRRKLDAFCEKNTTEKMRQEALKCPSCPKAAHCLKKTAYYPERFYRFEDSGLETGQKNEGFKTPGGVQYVARAGKYYDDYSEYTGAAAVFRTIMNYEYMWFNIRVQGGAYGCMSSANPGGECILVTYRDPHLKRSNDVFEGIPGYLENFDVDEREMTKFVIGTMSGVDSPLTPSAKGSRDMAMYFSETTYEDIYKTRQQIIDCSKEDIRRLAPMIRKALDSGNICVIGNEGKIEEHRDMFKNVAPLFE